MIVEERIVVYKLKTKTKGFTLVEILVAVSIVALLMTLALVASEGARKSSRDGRRKADLEEIRAALEMCYADNGVYPGTIYDNITCNAVDYLVGTPKDPADGTLNYDYNRGGGATTYTLCTHLETGDDTSPSLPDCSADCGSGNPCNYKTTNP
jgi:general secretion pathway protein G